VRLVVVSHACAVPPNQVLYAELERLTGWDMTLVLPRRWDTEFGPRAAERWPAFGGEIVPLPVIGSGSVPRHVYGRGLSETLKRAIGGAMFVHHEPYGLATMQAFAVLGRTETTLGFYSSQNLAKRYPAPVRWGERGVFARADYAVAATGAVVDVLRKKGYKGDANVLAMLGVDTARFRPAPQREPRELVVGFVGRLTFEKGVDVLLDALAQVKDVPVSAIVTGDGPQRDALHEQARRLGISDRVSWAGYVPHERAEEAYAKVDVLAVPSRTTRGWAEQFGRVVLEALACEVPVVAAASGELPSLLAATSGGWTFPEGDARALAARLSELVAQPEVLRAVGRAGRRVVDDRYSLARGAEALACTIERAVARRARVAE